MIERTLAAGERLRVDTGCLVALQPSVDFDIESIGNIKSAFFGGEGLFFATLGGPGHVWLQSLPLSRMARRIVAAARRRAGADVKKVRSWEHLGTFFPGTVKRKLLVIATKGTNGMSWPFCAFVAIPLLLVEANHVHVFFRR